MGILTQYFRLLLIVALVLSPVQALFAAQTAQQMDHSAMSVVTDVVADATQSGMMRMDIKCSQHGDSGNCQSTHKQCGNCPLPLGASPTLLKRAEQNTRQSTVRDVSLNSADLLPDYRPPRYS